MKIRFLASGSSQWTDSVLTDERETCFIRSLKNYSVLNSTFAHHFSQNVSILELRTLSDVGMCPADRCSRLESLAEGLKLGDLLQRAIQRQRGGDTIVNAVWAFLLSRQNDDIGLNWSHSRRILLGKRINEWGQRLFQGD